MKQYQNRLNHLMGMSLSDRIMAVEKDLISGLDEYKKIPPLDLAKALEVPLYAVDGSDPDSWSLWMQYKYVEIQPLAQLLDEFQPLELIEKIYTDEEVRYQEISKALNGVRVTKKLVIELLTLDELNELKSIAQTIAEEKLNDEGGDRYLQLAEYNVITSDLNFQAMLDGEYKTIDELKTPYDERDGKFLQVWQDKSKYVSYFFNDPDLK